MDLSSLQVSQVISSRAAGLEVVRWGSELSNQGSVASYKVCQARWAVEHIYPYPRSIWRAARVKHPTELKETTLNYTEFLLIS